jgi:transcriptional regulator with GAF, ATPase, and Fis domain
MSELTLSRQALASISALAREIGEFDTADEVLGSVAASAKACIGHRLLTILRLDPATLEVERLYTTNPAAYPTQGTKPMRDTWWGEHVLLKGVPYIGYNAQDIREHFADHDVISGLGLNAIINIPVRVAGQTLGTLNLLHDEAFYGEHHVGIGKLLSTLLAPTLMDVRRDR